MSQHLLGQVGNLRVTEAAMPVSLALAVVAVVLWAFVLWRNRRRRR